MRVAMVSTPNQWILPLNVAMTDVQSAVWIRLLFYSKFNDGPIFHIPQPEHQTYLQLNSMANAKSNIIYNGPIIL